jgi:hypothetical protein
LRHDDRFQRRLSAWTGRRVRAAVVLSMRDPRVRPSASLVTIVVERIYDMSAVALMFAINLIWFRPPFARVSFDRVRPPAGALGATISASLF